MKLSPSTIGTLLFTVAGIAVFVLMAKRTPDEGAEKSAMNFGMPIPAVVDEKMPETTMPEVAPATTDTTSSMPEATTPELEPSKMEETKVEETTIIPTTPETSMPESIEMKTEEMPADAPAVEGSMPAS